MKAPSRGAAVGVVAVAALGLVFASPAAAATSANLVKNPGADVGAGGDGYTKTPLTSWARPGGSLFTAVKWTTAGGFPVKSDPGPPDRGANFFAAGLSAKATITQTVSLAGYGSSIDARKATFALSGYFGGYSSQRDYSYLTVQWRSATGAVLGTTTIGKVTPKDRKNRTGLLQRTATAAIPAHVRSAALTVTAVRLDGGYNDGYVDSLQLTAKTA